jgi:hypothetical protein
MKKGCNMPKQAGKQQTNYVTGGKTASKSKPMPVKKK